MTSRRIDRRTFVKGGAAGLGLLAAAPGAMAVACSGGGSAPVRAAATGGRARLRSPGSLPDPRLPAGTDTMPQIDHIVVLMMENHSYDNYLGMLGRQPGGHRRGDGFTIGRGGLPTASNPAPDGTVQHAFHMPTTCQLTGKPSQEWNTSHVQYGGGTNQGFVRSDSGPVAMGYWTGDDLPFYYSLASTFPLADRWFASLLGQTYPNRRYLLAATSVGMVEDVAAQVATPAPNGTIWDRLNAHGVTWRNYYSTFPATSYVFLTDAEANSGNIVPVSQFFTDAANGSLPGFSLVDPEFSQGSEEDPQDIVRGEAFAASVVNAVMHSPAWPTTLLVWCYDEHGGYYDHVPPPPAIAPDAIAPLMPPSQRYDGFRRYGFRVPAAVVSPWARPNHVTHVVHDHTSILAMAERKWNLPAMTWRDANAADLTDFLDFRRPSFPEPPALAAPAAGPAQLACLSSGPGQIPPPGSDTPR